MRRGCGGALAVNGQEQWTCSRSRSYPPGVTEQELREAVARLRRVAAHARSRGDVEEALELESVARTGEELAAALAP